MTITKSFKVKRVLITGASGFIGSHLVEEGLRRGYEVWASVRPTSSRQYLADSRIRFSEFSLDSPERLSLQFKRLLDQQVRFDFIIHNAGTTRARSAPEFFSVNEGLTRNLVDSLENSGAIPEKFLFISTLAASGPGDPVSMEPISEKLSSNPVDAYGRSKLAAERFLASRPGLPYLVFRATGVYGPRERDYLQVIRVLNRGVELYAGTPLQRISFIFVTDLARMAVSALESGFTRRMWVISDGRNYSSREFSAIAKKILARRTVPVVVPSGLVRLLGEIFQSVSGPFGYIPALNRDKALIMTSRNWQCDPSMIFSDLGVTPEFDLKRGMGETIRWYRDHGWL